MVDMTDIWMDMSCGWFDRWMVDVTDIWTDMSCQWYDRWTSPWIHLNHACDVTPSGGGSSSVDWKILGFTSYWDYLDDTPSKLNLLW